MRARCGSWNEYFRRIRIEYEKIQCVPNRNGTSRPRKIDGKRVLHVVELETLRNGRISSEDLVRIVREKTGIALSARSINTIRHICVRISPGRAGAEADGWANTCQALVRMGRNANPGRRPITYRIL
jgi:hypothetical protein